MKYKVVTKKRVLIVTPFEGHKMNFMSDLNYFITMARDYGSRTLQFIDVLVDIEEDANLVKLKSNDGLVETFPSVEHRITRMITNKLRPSIIFIDGHEVMKDIGLEEIIEIVDREKSICIAAIKPKYLEHLNSRYFLIFYDKYTRLVSRDSIFSENNSIIIDGIEYIKVDDHLVER